MKLSEETRNELRTFGLIAAAIALLYFLIYIAHAVRALSQGLQHLIDRL